MRRHKNIYRTRGKIPDIGTILGKKAEFYSFMYKGEYAGHAVSCKWGRRGELIVKVYFIRGPLAGIKDTIAMRGYGYDMLDAGVCQILFEHKQIEDANYKLKGFKKRLKEIEYKTHKIL